MLTYLERCFDEKKVEIIYLSINLLFISANKAVAGNLVFKVIFSLNIEHSKKKSICIGERNIEQSKNKSIEI